MASQMLQLGAFQFSINTLAYADLKKTIVYKWIATPRVDEGEALQYYKEQSQVIKLSGVAYPFLLGGVGAVAELQQEAEKGVPLMLVSSTGDVWGKWIIETIEETETEFLANGKPRKINFNLSLRKFYELEK